MRLTGGPLQQLGWRLSESDGPDKGRSGPAATRAGAAGNRNEPTAPLLRPGIWLGRRVIRQARTYTNMEWDTASQMWHWRVAGFGSGSMGQDDACDTRPDRRGVFNSENVMPPPVLWETCVASISLGR